MIAAFIALRLRSVLGRKTGHEQRRPNAFQRSSQPDGTAANGSAQADDMPPPPPMDPPEIVADDKVKRGLAEVRLADPSFDLEGFVEGSKAAFAMILDAYAKGDRDTLRPLLASDVFASFDSVIAERETEDRVVQFELVSIGKSELAGAAMSGHDAQLTMRFVSEQINVVRDAAGEVIEGDSAEIVEVTDIWTFERNVQSSDPNWLLVETRAT